jgi:hypothetical protein
MIYRHFKDENEAYLNGIVWFRFERIHLSMGGEGGGGSPPPTHFKLERTCELGERLTQKSSHFKHLIFDEKLRTILQI